MIHYSFPNYGTVLQTVYFIKLYYSCAFDDENNIIIDHYDKTNIQRNNLIILTQTYLHTKNNITETVIKYCTVILLY